MTGVSQRTGSRQSRAGRTGSGRPATKSREPFPLSCVQCCILQRETQTLLFISPDIESCSQTGSCMWMSPDCRVQSHLGQKKRVFYTNYYPPCCRLSLLNRTFLNSASVSILFSRHHFSSGFLKRPGFPWRQEIPGRW